MTFLGFHKSIHFSAGQQIITTTDPQTGQVIQQVVQTVVDPTTGQTIQTMVPVNNSGVPVNNSGVPVGAAGEGSAQVITVQDPITGQLTQQIVQTAVDPSTGQTIQIPLQNGGTKNKFYFQDLRTHFLTSLSLFDRQFTTTGHYCH